jgi:DsbC/DsbD-like thiol-disulfide interchange protein
MRCRHAAIASLHDEFNGAPGISHLHPNVMKMHWSRLLRSVAAMLLVVLGVGAACAAENVSPWDGDARSAARLISGARPSNPGAPLRAGIEIRLGRGWHTYWRYPGDAGVPPRFDFGGSQNVKAVEVLWPAPRRLSEAGLDSIGYDRDVILPLRVTPQDEAKPVTLRIKLDYAICEKLCVPAQTVAELALADAESTQDARLATAEALVPRKVALGVQQALGAQRALGPQQVLGPQQALGAQQALSAQEALGPQQALGAQEALAVRSVRREEGGDRPRVMVDVAVPRGASVDVFAEGPTEQWALPLPVAVDGAASGLQRFVFELDGAPPDAKYEGARINLTVVTDGDAIEVPIHLD